MDELLIEDKRYVSSKRAAKVTGYAKDYIGQLCREGRVPARLVGRSWYVLEAAIQDHRFGTPEMKSETSDTQTPTSSWEAPRYESSRGDVLPSINRLQEASASESAPEHPLQDSWKAWFDRVTDTSREAALATSIPPTSQEDAPEEQNTEREEQIIPIHTVYDLPPEDLLPRHSNPPIEEVAEIAPVLSEVQEIRIHKKRGAGVVRMVQLIGGVLALTAASLAVMGTGYFDRYIISTSQVGLVAGVSLYER